MGCLEPSTPAIGAAVVAAQVGRPPWASGQAQRSPLGPLARTPKHKTHRTPARRVLCVLGFVPRGSPDSAARPARAPGRDDRCHVAVGPSRAKTGSRSVTFGIRPGCVNKR